MAAPRPPSVEDVAEAMAMSFEREDAAGALWCPPNDANVLRRWVTDRSRQLGGGIRRVVRFARLARLADGHDYVRFVYVRVPSLRTRHFKEALHRAVAEGCLVSSIADVTETGVRLKEPTVQAHAAAGEGFEIDYVQMPRLAALLDVLHNALGYVAVADLLAPILVAGSPAIQADDVARALQARFNAWLSERLGSLDHMRQAQVMRAFLASRRRVEPDAIDDEAIVSFWTAQAVAAEEGEGFRLYRSAARALLRYRKALQDAVTAAQIERALPLGGSTEYAGVDLERTEPAELSIDAWQSPLRLLSMPPANAIKWLNGNERLQLLNYLGGPRPDEDAAVAPTADAEEAARWDTALSGGDRFDLRFLRTLLRVDVFGAAQSSIVGRLRKRVAAAVAVEQVMAPVRDSAYDDCAMAYATVRDQLQLQALAALVTLMDAGAAEALMLLRHFGGQDAIDAVTAASRGNVITLTAPEHESSIDLDDHGEIEPMVADELIERMSCALSAAALRPDALLPDATRELIAQARAAGRKVNRLGFRREDRSDPRMLLSLRSAVGAVIDLLAELDRLQAALSTSAHCDEARADRVLFSAAFARIYCGRTAPSGAP
jgi:hypothetical protein